MSEPTLCVRDKRQTRYEDFTAVVNYHYDVLRSAANPEQFQAEVTSQRLWSWIHDTVAILWV